MIAQTLQLSYPTLHLYQENRDWFVRGAFHVRMNGVLLRSFYILIKIPSDYPVSVPRVWEIGNTLPRHIDNHLSNDGELCLFVPDERWKYWSKGASFGDFLEYPVKDFFLSHIYRESDKNHTWAFGERRHGYLGIVDYYREELGTDNIAVILRFLEYLANKHPKGHLPCYCGSGRKMRVCHFDKLLELRAKIDPNVAKQSIRALKFGLERERREIVLRSSERLKQLYSNESHFH